MRLKLDLSLMEHYERHCPSPERSQSNGPRAEMKYGKQIYLILTLHMRNPTRTGWLKKVTRLVFLGEARIFTMELISILLQLQMLRTVFDVGCGVASFGGYLLSSDIITMSLAPNDVHQNQIQFALERGIPAYLGVLGTKRLPYPSRSFELAHCSRCRIDWLQRDGIHLLELEPEEATLRTHLQKHMHRRGRSQNMERDECPCGTHVLENSCKKEPNCHLAETTNK
ncbi:putative S-adenosyl-L-methionine-dependent methyltransferase [Rosa chinensis]|uniref:Methyltransferase n=1 Tax=Rosa chinensis TaxID=74649 RepID=A0A2P6QQZ1_ROSCH|nr:putative S-adenosyl-L-methionine-dependent methyltransferase [Rosa chinensis]